MGLFSKKRKDITMRVYRTNQQAQQAFEPAAMPETKLPVAHDEEQVEGMWEKCPECGAVIYTDDLIANLNVCTNCSHHFRLSARQRIMYTADDDTFTRIWSAPILWIFRDTSRRYRKYAGIPMKRNR